MSERSENRFVATWSGAVRVGSEHWRTETMSKVFHVNQPISDVLKWARRMGVDGASVNNIKFSELDES